MNDKVNRMSASLKIENIKVKELYPGCLYRKETIAI